MAQTSAARRALRLEEKWRTSRENWHEDKEHLGVR